TGEGVASQNQPSARVSRLNFSDPAQREAHLQAFQCWLPQVLHDAPGLRWERLPSRVMGYLIELRDQQPTGRKVDILVQNLLPKGAKQESERQFFLIGEMAGRLFTEIGQLLEATHAGAIPMVSPSHSTKEEDLSPEPYLFQWSASADGRIGLLVAKDVENML